MYNFIGVLIRLLIFKGSKNGSNMSFVRIEPDPTMLKFNIFKKNYYENVMLEFKT